MLPIISIREQRAVGNGQNACCLGQWKDPKLVRDQMVKDLAAVTKDLDLILWVMGNHWGLIHSNIELLLVFHLGRAFQPFFPFSSGIQTLLGSACNLLKRSISPCSSAHVHSIPYVTWPPHSDTLALGPAPGLSFPSLPVDVYDYKTRRRNQVWPSPKF